MINMTEEITKNKIEEVGTNDKPTVSVGSLEKGVYIGTVGRRKTAVARVRITESGRNQITINGKTVSDYFPTSHLQNTIQNSIDTANITQKFSISIKVLGGGTTSQAEAIRLGIARAYVKYDLSLRGNLKSAGYLKRDPRIKERKKPGLKKARKAAQWSKR